MGQGQRLDRRLVLMSRHEGEDDPDPQAEGSTKPASRLREDDLHCLLDAVSQHRLVTITGAPGVGKSHLALQAANRVGAAGEVETAVVGVAGLVDAEQVVAAVARARTSAAGQPLLVVLDDCDHLVETCAQVAESLVAAEVRVLATSREPLRIPGEVVWQLPPLSLPEPGGPVTLPEALASSEAVQLFCERAAAAARGFVPTPDNIAAIVEVCRRLDGLPLAIELAAGRAGVLSPAELVAQWSSRCACSPGPPAPPGPATRACARPWSRAGSCSAHPSRRCSGGSRSSRGPSPPRCARGSPSTPRSSSTCCAPWSRSPW